MTDQQVSNINAHFAVKDLIEALFYRRGPLRSASDLVTGKGVTGYGLMREVGKNSAEEIVGEGWFLEPMPRHSVRTSISLAGQRGQLEAPSRPE